MMGPRERAAGALQSIYLTLVSFISSLAFGYLLSSLRLELLFGPGWEVVYWLKAVATLQLILIVWHEYASNTILLRWVVDYLDSLIPFLVGIGFFAVITLLNQSTPAWFAGVGAIAILGGGAYVNQYIKARGEAANRAVLNLERFHVFTIGYTLSTGIVSLGTAYLLRGMGPDHPLQVVAVLAINLILVGLIIGTHWLRRDALHGEAVAPTAPPSTGPGPLA